MPLAADGYLEVLLVRRGSDLYNSEQELTQPPDWEGAFKQRTGRSEALVRIKRVLLVPAKQEEVPIGVDTSEVGLTNVRTVRVGEPSFDTTVDKLRPSLFLIKGGPTGVAPCRAVCLQN